MCPHLCWLIGHYMYRAYFDFAEKKNVEKFTKTSVQNILWITKISLTQIVSESLLNVVIHVIVINDNRL